MTEDYYRSTDKPCTICKNTSFPRTYTPIGAICSNCSVPSPYMLGNILKKLEYIETPIFTRLYNAIMLAMNGCRPVPLQDGWDVHGYKVTLSPPKCQCADFRFRGHLCKHILLTALTWLSDEKMSLLKLAYTELTDSQVNELRSVLCRYFAHLNGGISD